jgi:hypothetical protein
MRFVPLQTGVRSEKYVNVDHIVSVGTMLANGKDRTLPFAFDVNTSDGNCISCAYATEHDAAAAMRSIINPPKDDAPSL